VSRARLRVIRFACVDPSCEGLTELHFVGGSRGPSFEEFKRNFGEFMPCTSCDGTVRRFKKHPREVEGTAGGVA